MLTVLCLGRPELRRGKRMPRRVLTGEGIVWCANQEAGEVRSVREGFRPGTLIRGAYHVR